MSRSMVRLLAHCDSLSNAFRSGSPHGDKHLPLGHGSEEHPLIRAFSPHAHTPAVVVTLSLPITRGSPCRGSTLSNRPAQAEGCFRRAKHAAMKGARENFFSKPCAGPSLSSRPPSMAMWAILPFERGHESHSPGLLPGASSSPVHHVGS